ncbi:NYN domain-containing protein [Microbacterium rhizomatis]|uniref:NYN domain-containing protein n=1 Tax=Microbacterium rhizomatis TaxID=1631477 RepID=A0A5J5IX18_9MICO|nr:NYN domain-containing protein [Microbacterium rhizomatis]KAA9105616.1 NYN domain-containing protein [Microbacterium rhizomatis]
MPDSQSARVAVYLDFDNIVMSWYDRVHGRNSYARDRQRIAENPTEPEIAERLAAATIDVGAIIDFAASFGTLVLTRAYADWSSPVNAIYRTQLVGRAVDLVQLFPAAAYAKNGADIRLAVDTVEDMFRLPDLTHVVIVAGDSDYVPLAQRCKRLGRYVIGVGVAGSTAKSLAASCDEFEAYDSLPGVKPIVRAPAKEAHSGRAAKEPAAKEQAAKAPTEPAADAPAKDAPKTRSPGRRTSAKAKAETADAAATAESAVSGEPQTAPPAVVDGPPAAPGTALEFSGASDVEATLVGALDVVAPKRTNRRVSSKTLAAAAEAAASVPPLVEEPAADEPAEDPQETATALLERALRLGHDKDDAEWLHSSAVKTHMRRMDPSFSEKALGYRSFSDFVKARESIAELEETGHERLVRLREQ